MRVLIAGCGYLGFRSEGNWRSKGDEVFGVRRSAEAAAELTAAHKIVASLTSPSRRIWAKLPGPLIGLWTAFLRAKAAWRNIAGLPRGQPQT